MKKTKIEAARRCIQQTKAGRPCESPPRIGQRYCYFHDEAVASERRTAQRRGGQANGNTRLSDGVPEFFLRDNREIADAAVWLFNSVVHGQIDTREAYAGAILLRIVQKAREAEQADDKLASLEQAVNRSRPVENLFDPDRNNDEPDQNNHEGEPK